MSDVLTREEFERLHALAEHPETDESHYAKFMDRIYAHDAALRSEVARLTKERDAAVAHDRQSYPTAAAYDAACSAIGIHKARADAAESRVAALTEALREIAHYDAVGWIAIADGRRRIAAAALEREEKK